MSMRKVLEGWTTTDLEARLASLQAMHEIQERTHAEVQGFLVERIKIIEAILSERDET